MAFINVIVIIPAIHSHRGNMTDFQISIPVLPSSVLSVRVQGDSIQKYNTAVLRCQVPHSAAAVTEVVSWMRGNTQLFPSPRGGKFRFRGLVMFGIGISVVSKFD